MRATSRNVALVFRATLVLAVMASLIILFATSNERGNLPFYFTIQSSVVALLYLDQELHHMFGRPALRRRLLHIVKGGVIMYLLVTAVGYQLLLSATHHPTGVAAVANVLLHYVVPVGMLLDWLFVDAKGAWRLRHVIAWSVYPVAYLVFSVVRGGITGWYPYPFVDVATLGLTKVLLNSALMSVGFVAVAIVLIVVDASMKRANRFA